MEEKLEINFYEPMIGLLIMNLKTLEGHIVDKKLTSPTKIINLIEELETFDVESQLQAIKIHWLLIKSDLEKKIHDFFQKEHWSKDLIQTFFLTDALFDLLTISDSLLGELKLNLENQDIEDYQKLIALMKKIAGEKMRQNYALLNRLWGSLETPTEFRRLSQLSLALEDYSELAESQELIWELLTLPSKLSHSSSHWRCLAPLVNNAAITHFIDFFESNLEAVDEESHLTNSSAL